MHRYILYQHSIKLVLYNRQKKNTFSRIHHMNREIWYEYFDYIFHHSVILATFFWRNRKSLCLGWNIIRNIVCRIESHRTKSHRPNVTEISHWQKATDKKSLTKSDRQKVTNKKPDKNSLTKSHRQKVTDKKPQTKCHWQSHRQKITNKKRQTKCHKQKATDKKSLTKSYNWHFSTNRTNSHRTKVTICNLKKIYFKVNFQLYWTESHIVIFNGVQIR